MQRSSDWLRSGQFSDPAEAALTSDLQKLGQQVREAAQRPGQRATPLPKDAALNRAMDDLVAFARPARRSRRTPQRSAWTGPTRGPAVSARPTQPQRATRSAGPGRTAARTRRASGTGWSGQAGQGKRVRAKGQAVRSAIAPPARPAMQAAVAIAAARSMATTIPATRASQDGPRRRSRAQPGRYAA